MLKFETYTYTVVNGEVEDADVVYDEDGEPAAAASSSSSKSKSKKETRTGMRVVLATAFMLARTPGKINADGTHKLTVADLNVLMMGFDDAASHFQPVLLVVTTTERAGDFKFGFEQWSEAAPHLRRLDSGAIEYVEDGSAGIWRPLKLLADGSNAIKKGFLLAFGTPEGAKVQPWHRTEDDVYMCGNHLEAVRHLI